MDKIDQLLAAYQACLDAPKDDRGQPVDQTANDALLALVTSDEFPGPFEADEEKVLAKAIPPLWESPLPKPIDRAFLETLKELPLMTIAVVRSVVLDHKIVITAAKNPDWRSYVILYKRIVL